MFGQDQEHDSSSFHEAYESWRSAVRAEFGDDCFEARLATKLYEGITVDPLYTRVHLPEPHARLSVPRRSGRPRMRLVHPSTAEDLAPLASHVWEFEGIWLRGPSHSPADVAAALEAVPLERSVLLLPSATQGVDVVRDAIESCNVRGIDLRAASIAFDMDPLGAIAAGAEALSLEPSLRTLGTTASLLVQRGARARCATIALDAYSNRGSNAVQELAAALSTGIAYLQAMERAGVHLRDAAHQLVFRVPVGCDLFLEVAKLRALRATWARVLSGCGISEMEGGLVLHACAAERVFSRRGRSINLLRATVAAVAAVLGGADWVSVAPLTGTFNADARRGRELARSLQLVIWHETQLIDAEDPAAGSFYLERLTHELCREAWQKMQDVMQLGGMAAVLADGSWLASIEEARAWRSQDLRCHRAALTGITDFVELDEPPLENAWTVASGVRRLSEDFETVRDKSDAWARRTGTRPRAFILRGAQTPGESRQVLFARNAFETAGFAVTLGSDSDCENWTASFLRSGAQVGVVCMDSEPHVALANAQTLRQLGAQSLCVVGRAEHAPNGFKEVGVALWVYPGADLIAALGRLLDDGAP